MKQYKSTDELLEILKEKNVVINDMGTAKTNIEKYSYYSIINGYKYIFKTKKRRI